MLLPVLRKYPEGVHSFFATLPPWIGHLTCFILSAAFTAVVFKVLSPRLAHLASTGQNPPVWLAWAVAACVVCAADLAVGLGPGTFQVSPWE
jgi:hypothetical protein